ncbi:GIY-YIG nuclease family protein [Patescibacteria group bacterium]|nr:GIY-YIG nuclease family protein [Patescibacteria group bacterium]MBU4452753.1 GIY-YIG nuclease family protein [Patescibacteria group bacterium]MCG2687333.1 GIY-YIG nuclease family protein [Candidatus Parcubacteria bacterium]
MKITVYVLASLNDGTLYIGITKNLEQRLHQHNAGYNRSTKHKAPYRIILTEEHATYIEARQREKYLKSGCGREFIKKYAGMV